MKKTLLLLVLFVTNHITAQKKNFTMAEAVNGLTSTLAIKNIKQLKWMGNTEYYAYVVSNDSENVVIANSPMTFESETLLSLAKINKQLEKVGEKPLKKMPNIEWISNTSFYILHNGKYIEFNTLAKDSTETFIANELPNEADNISKYEKELSFAYTENFNLFVKQKNKPAIKITEDANENILYGTAVHRQEFGIENGIFWSPLGNAIAFYRMDQSMVADYPIVNWDTVPATVKNIKYPMAGGTSHHVSLGVYDIASAQTIYLNTGDPKEQYLTSVTWSPDAKFIYVALLNRDQNYLQLNQYNAKTGEKIKTLFEEKNEKYVEPQNPLYFINNNAEQFVWWSQRDGFMHLYLYKTDGTLIRPITKGNWIVNEIVGYNKRSQEIIFTATKESAMQKNIYAVNITNAAIRTISKDFGTHKPTLSADGNFLIDEYSNATTPRNIDIQNTQTLQQKRLLTASNPLENYNTAIVEPIVLKAEDGTELYGKLIKPFDFDANKKYPIIVYLYNGPHLQLVKDVFPNTQNLWYDFMTQKGYILFVMDGRGSSNRGFDFETATFRKLGTVELQDQLKGVEYLKSLSYIDANRMGIHGWSYGGFMTTSMMLRHPSIFKCGVAGGPVLDWSMYEIMYTERYMDTPQQNPEGYANSLLFSKIKNLQGKLLLIHGSSDPTVVWQQSMIMLKKSIEENIQLDYFVYPGYEHNVRGKDREHLMQKISNYFDENLKN